MIEAQNTPETRTQSPDQNRLADILEALSRRLTRDETPVHSKSAKIPDPPLLTDGTEPTFESWKLQKKGKQCVNSDYFPSSDARMAYVFSRTGGDAQKHLLPRYADDSRETFLSEQEMLEHLPSIYEDPFKSANARLEYRGLMMKVSETFAEFYTRLLHLSGQAQIPQEDLLPDLFDKLTIDLQRAAIPVFTTIKTHQGLSKQCLALDQGLRRIKARSDRIRNRNSLPGTGNPPVTPRPASTPNSNTSANSPAVRTPRAGTPATPRPVYSDAKIQALSDQGKCFNCQQPGHFSKECPKTKENTVQEVDTEIEKNSGIEEH